jgi:uncharacterized membrane protein
MGKSEQIVGVVLKAIALAMAVAGIVLGYVNANSGGITVPLLAIGLFALALAGFMRNKAG